MIEHKVVFLGNMGVGKTSMVQFAVTHAPHAALAHTIGCNCNQVDVDLGASSVPLSVWDTAGQELYRAIIPIYVRESAAAIIVYDITDEKSFLDVAGWIQLLTEVEKDAAIYIVANKIDLERSAVDQVGAALYAEGVGAKFFKVSAINGTGIVELFTQVAADLLEAQPIRPAVVPIGAQRSKQQRCC
jgi:Ras-related protein Rab-21